MRKKILYLNQEFEGLINYLQKESNIKKEINITYSSHQGLDPYNLFLFNDKNKGFMTKDLSDLSIETWICFEFLKNEIIPTNYTIRSYSKNSNWYHPKSWVIEGSKNNSDWETIDEESLALIVVEAMIGLFEKKLFFRKTTMIFSVPVVKKSFGISFRGRLILSFYEQEL